MPAVAHRQEIPGGPASRRGTRRGLEAQQGQAGQEVAHRRQVAQARTAAAGRKSASCSPATCNSSASVSQARQRGGVRGRHSCAAQRRRMPAAGGRAQRRREGGVGRPAAARPRRRTARAAGLAHLVTGRSKAMEPSPDAHHPREVAQRQVHRMRRARHQGHAAAAASSLSRPR